jgi:hypothetical protein
LTILLAIVFLVSAMIPSRREDRVSNWNVYRMREKIAQKSSGKAIAMPMAELQTAPSA